MAAIDRRSARTRAALHEALTKLILREGYETVTVQDICREAGVGRSTFYTHYTNKDDLKRAGIETIRAELNAHGKATPAEEVPRLAFSLPMFEHARDHVDHYRAVASGRSGAMALESIRQLLSDQVKAELRANRDFAAAAPRDFMTQYLVGAFMAVLTWWLDRGAKPTAEDMDRTFRSLALNGFGPRAAVADGAT